MDSEGRLATLERQQALFQARHDLWQTITRYARGIDEQRDKELAEIFTDDVVLQTQPWTQRPLVGKVLARKAFRILPGLSAPTTVYHQSSAFDQRRWHSERLRHLVGGAGTGGPLVWWLAQLRVGVALGRGSVEDQPHVHYPGLYNHP